MLWKFTVLILFLGLVALLVVFNKEISAFSDVTLLKQEGQRAMTVENWQQAIEVYERGVAVYPERVDLSLTLANLYQREGEPAKAEALYKKLVQLAPENLDVTLGYARLLMQDRARINDAVNLCRQALKSNETDPGLLSTLGDIFKQAADDPREKRRKVKHWLYDWAIYYYRMALKQDDTLYQTRFNLGYVYQRNAQLDKAAMEYCHSMLMMPNRYELHYNLGIVLVELHMLEEGYRHLSRSLELLREQDRLKDARVLAEQIQAFKNTVYHSNDHAGLSSPVSPDFLDSRCFLKQSGGGR
jgi:Tfp pilus assembly protein PilF